MWNETKTFCAALYITMFWWRILSQLLSKNWQESFSLTQIRLIRLWRASPRRWHNNAIVFLKTSKSGIESDSQVCIPKQCFMLQGLHKVTTICKLALTVNFLTCCFTFQTLGLVRQNYQVWLAVFFLIGWTNNFAPERLASLFLVGNCLAKPGVQNMKQQVKLLTVNASLEMVVCCML